MKTVRALRYSEGGSLRARAENGYKVVAVAAAVVIRGAGAGSSSRVLARAAAAVPAVVIRSRYRPSQLQSFSFRADSVVILVDAVRPSISLSQVVVRVTVLFTGELYRPHDSRLGHVLQPSTTIETIRIE